MEAPTIVSLTATAHLSPSTPGASGVVLALEGRLRRRSWRQRTRRRKTGWSASRPPNAAVRTPSGLPIRPPHRKLGRARAWHRCWTWRGEAASAEEVFGVRCLASPAPPPGCHAGPCGQVPWLVWTNWTVTLWPRSSPTAAVACSWLVWLRCILRCVPFGRRQDWGACILVGVDQKDSYAQ